MSSTSAVMTLNHTILVKFTPPAFVSLTVPLPSSLWQLVHHAQRWIGHARFLLGATTNNIVSRTYNCPANPSPKVSQSVGNIVTLQTQPEAAVKLSFFEGVGCAAQEEENPLRLHRAMGCAAYGRIGGMLRGGRGGTRWKQFSALHHGRRERVI